MSKLKKGDKVKRIGGCASLPVGTICTVECIDSWTGDVYVEGRKSPYSPCCFELVTPAYPNPPHKHAELIKAWADGAVVQVKRPNKDCWEDLVCCDPCWFRDLEYRIKPANPNAGKIAEIESTISELQQQLKGLKNGD